MALRLHTLCEDYGELIVATGRHPFVERIRGEREIITAVNSYRSVLIAELVGTSEKAIADWFQRIPTAVRMRDEVCDLRERLVEAGQITKLVSSGSHRGAMVGATMGRDATRSSIVRVKDALVRVSAGGGGD